MVAVVILFVVLGIISRADRPVPAGDPQGGPRRPAHDPAADPVAADAVLQLQKNLGQIGALVAIVLAMGAVATEKERGHGRLRPDEAGLARGLPRREARRPRVRARAGDARGGRRGLGLYRASSSSPGRSWAGSPSPSSPGWPWRPGRSITFLASTVSGSAAVAAGVGVVALIGVSLVAAIPQVGRFLPAGLDAPARALARPAHRASTRALSRRRSSAARARRRLGPPRLALVPPPGALASATG